MDIINYWGESIREKSFWLMDQYAGRNIKNNYIETSYYFNNPEAVDEYVSIHLGKLIKHATMCVPFYKQYEGCEVLRELAVVNKDMINENYPQFTAKSVDLSKLHKVKTSGSQGIPFTIYHDRRKITRKLADLIYFNETVGLHVGCRHALIRTKRKRLLKQFLQNEILILASKRNDRSLASTLNKIINKRIKFIIGHPSIMMDLAEYVRTNNIDLRNMRLQGFIATSEPLFEYNRLFIEETFNCSVLARYSSEELGVIAHELLQDRRYHVNVASVIIEILSFDNDSPVEVGQPGRIVVTDLHAYAMPIIRYDTGDIGVLSDKPSEVTGGIVFEKIEGRKLDIILDTNGTKIFPLTLYDLITEYLTNRSPVSGFQFIQRDYNSYILLLQMRSDNLDSMDVFLPLKKRILDILGDDAKVEISITDKLRLLRSGKQPFIINEMFQ
jgi:phenylacetate-CoA ligase